MMEEALLASSDVKHRDESKRLHSPSDWNFDLIETYFQAIRRTAERFGLDTYPTQLELITAEQMLDAYASVGMPVNYRHWSYGKHFIQSEKSYRRGHMGLAYEIVINSDPASPTSWRRTRCPCRRW